MTGTTVAVIIVTFILQWGLLFYIRGPITYIINLKYLVSVNNINDAK